MYLIVHQIISRISVGALDTIFYLACNEKSKYTIGRYLKSVLTKFPESRVIPGYNKI